MSDFIPQALGDFAQWVRLQTTKRAGYAPTLGYSEAETTQHNAADQAVLASIGAAEAAMSQARAAVVARDAAIDAYTTATRAAIARAKTHPAYSAAIGQDMQWLSSPASAQSVSLKPSLQQRPSAEGLRLDWSKLGQDGVQVFRRPAGSADWGRPLAFDTRSPYIDTETGLHGRYEYCVHLMKDDKPVGERSDVVEVVLG
ncbi:hypothetical protein [Hymenobacter cheonanensis]|uniref:hypothetical protein n=1 Tax=Hymenobacter sp. CA2-7 TaxID=3063993 RepID=UPI0027124084|nr:hypothetical protein [Hymenobacter sp. CA2-7]MDO7886726.1 hypothetical protein [Hymenobacter sp. CA2-7]